MAKPISVSPSQAWQGDDGPWSTFAIQVGNPVQIVNVLVASVIPETWVVFPAGCTTNDPTSCPNDRGGIFNTSTSSSWRKKQIYQLGVELNLDYHDSDNGEYGFDRLGLGYPGSGGPVLNDQVIAGVATKDFYLGMLGLAPNPINFTYADTHPSLLTNLKNQSIIPSLSYGYSAGASYRLKRVDGTLTLGGYDASRFTPNDVDFTFASDISRDLVVGLQSVAFSDSKTTRQELLPTGILTFIDSTVPHIWLPVKACQAFENAFGIEYNTTNGLYLVNDTTHDALLARNASVTFKLGNQVTGGKTVDITLPYRSFNLQASYTYLNDNIRYFPIRRAANDTQYTLGRTFLQEAYLIVNYEHSNFSISQAAFVENAQSELVPINANSTTVTVASTTPSPTPTTHKLTTGTIAGIIVAIVILCILTIGAGLFILYRRRRDRQKSMLDGIDHTAEPELDAAGKSMMNELFSPPGEADGRGVSKLGHEMEGSKPGIHGRFAEAEGSRGGVEMEGSKGGVEMEGQHHPAAVELDAGPSYPAELPSPDTGASELPSSTQTSALSSPAIGAKPLPSPRTRGDRLSPRSDAPGAQSPLRSGSPLVEANTRGSSSAKPETRQQSPLPLQSAQVSPSPPSPPDARATCPNQSPFPHTISGSDSSSNEQQSGERTRERWSFRRRRDGI